MEKLYAEDSAKDVPPDTADKLRKMPAFLADMQDPEELRSLAAWKVHTDRRPQGHMEPQRHRNRRLTFRTDMAEREICDLNSADYHEDKRSKRHGREEPSSSQRFHSVGDYRACGPLGNGRCCRASGFPARAVQPSQRQG